MKSLLPEGGLEFHNPNPLTPSVCTYYQQNQPKLFHVQTMLLHHVSHYRSMSLRCYKNPYRSLFTLYCGACLSKPSSAAIDWAKRCGCRSLLTALVALKWSKGRRGEREVRGRLMSQTLTHSHWDTGRRWGAWMKQEVPHPGVAGSWAGGWTRGGSGEAFTMEKGRLEKKWSWNEGSCFQPTFILLLIRWW